MNAIHGSNPADARPLLESDGLAPPDGDPFLPTAGAAEMEYLPFSGTRPEPQIADMTSMADMADFGTSGQSEGSYWRRFSRALAAFENLTDEHRVVSELIKTELSGFDGDLRHSSHTLLDIGPGHGTLVRLLAKPSLKCTAVEPNPILASAVRPLYREVVCQKWETRPLLPESFSVVLACQVLYYFPRSMRAKCIHSMIDHLEPGGVLFLTLDSFEGPFGSFLRRWSSLLGIADHVVLPEQIRNTMRTCKDVQITEIPLATSLTATSVTTLAEGLSVYFDVNPALAGALSREYTAELLTFRRNGAYCAVNPEVLWVVRKKA